MHADDHRWMLIGLPIRLVAPLGEVVGWARAWLAEVGARCGSPD